MKLVFLMITVFALSSCAELSSISSELPSSFTTENIMKVHQGMSSNEILKTFGTPKNVSQSTCGTSTSQPWNCTTWEYGKFPYDRASFTFAGDTPDSLILNNFKIDRK